MTFSLQVVMDPPHPQPILVFLGMTLWFSHPLYSFSVFYSLVAFLALGFFSPLFNTNLPQSKKKKKNPDAVATEEGYT